MIIQQIIKSILENDLTTIVGPSGAGKTAMSNYIAFHIDDRRIFEDGVAYFDLKSANNTGFLQQKILQAIGQNTTGKRKKMVKKIFDLLANKEPLFILNDIHSILKHDR